MLPEREPSSDLEKYEKDRIAWNLPLPRVLSALHERTMPTVDEDDLDRDDTTELESAA